MCSHQLLTRRMYHDSKAPCGLSLLFPPRHPQSRRTYVSDALTDCSHVFVRVDKVRRPLDQPYNGPYRVIQRSTKHYTIDCDGRPNVISLDRLKAAHMEQPPAADTETSHLPSTPPPPPTRPPQQRVTRYGRHVHWPKRLVYYV